jgi:hypothetical protein
VTHAHWEGDRRQLLQVSSLTCSESFFFTEEDATQAAEGIPAVAVVHRIIGRAFVLLRHVQWRF